MASKKTEGVLRAEAAAVGLEMLRAPSNAHSKGVYRCLLPSCGWEGEKTAHGVWRGTGCLRCTGQENKKMEAQYLADARAVGLEMLRAPLHSKDRGLYRCRCGWEGEKRGNDVRRGKGCIRCAGLERKTEDQLRADAKAVGLEMLLAPSNAHDRGLYRCRCGWEGLKKGNKVQQGSGCPRCAKYGFDQARPAVFYVKLIYSIAYGEWTLFGITGALKGREQYYRKVFKEYGFKQVDGCVIEFNRGADALSVENTVLNGLHPSGGLPFKGGKTESFKGDHFHRLVGISKLLAAK